MTDFSRAARLSLRMPSARVYWALMIALISVSILSAVASLYSPVLSGMRFMNWARRLEA